MSIEFNKRDMLLGLNALGAGYEVPNKSPKSNFENVWARAQSNPWFFEVDENGTLIEDGVAEPEVWGDVFDYIVPTDFNDPSSIIQDFERCYPLTAYIDSQLDCEIEDIEDKLYLTEDAAEKAFLQGKLTTLRQFRDEHDEPWADWIELEGNAGCQKFKAMYDEWLNEPIDWRMSEWIPDQATSQGAAFSFFDAQPQELLSALGVVIVDGEHPGSSYVAAELRKDIDEANAQAAMLQLPFRFRPVSTNNQVVGEKACPVPAEPSKLARAISESSDLTVLHALDERLRALNVYNSGEMLSSELLASVDIFLKGLPKPTGYISGMGRQMHASKLRAHVRAFFYMHDRVPNAEEMQRLWDAT